MHFLLTTLNVASVLSTSAPNILDMEKVKDDEILALNKWENDDYICRGHILNGMCDSLFDIYQNMGSSKELWDSLESNYG